MTQMEQIKHASESEMKGGKEKTNEPEEEKNDKRKTFDEYAVQSFMENPDMYRRKISEFN